MSRLFIIIVSLIIWPCQALALEDDIYKDLDTFTRIIDIVDKQYVEKVDEHGMMMGAIQGMLLSLDPHTLYLPPQFYKDFQSDTSGKFGGVGLEVTIEDGILTVVSPLEGSPAATAGIQAGDRIIKIDGHPTKGWSLFDSVHKMRGPRGKAVTITVWREGLSKPVDATIVRDIIRMKSVRSELLEKNYGYLRIASFQENTSAGFLQEIKNLEASNQGRLAGLILDLRNNPGGLFSEAVEISDIFMARGVIVSTKGRNKKEEIKKAKQGSAYEELPVIVMVNKGSASASEIVAGALQDTHRAKILGTSSFGKGSVQTLFELGDNAALKMTIAKYYTPRGRSIDGKGIEPDIVVDENMWEKVFQDTAKEQRPSLEDYQKAEALAYLKKIR